MSAPAGRARRVSGLLPDDAATARAGTALAAALRPGDVVFLAGPLGAGKSALARAVILARLAAEGRREEAPSPTYTLVQSYETASGPILHADLYRLSDPEEAVELGLLEPDPAALLLIEWAERLGPEAPARRLEIALDLASDPTQAAGAGRRLSAEGRGGGWDDALDALEGALS